MKRLTTLAAAGMITVSAALDTTTAWAGLMSVRPVLIQVPAPGAVATLTLGNLGNKRTTHQVRLFRWTQKNGRDVLSATRTVVASPPLLRIAPRRESVIRIVRVSKRPVKGEESYRLVVDEIPERKKVRGMGVIIAVRYSIPVFFFEPGTSKPKISWSARRRGRGLILTARNAGGRYERIVGLRISSGGRTQTITKGLAGYVLGKSARQWRLRVKIPVRGTITVKGRGVHGRFTVRIPVR